MNMKIATANVNGIRAAINKNFVDWCINEQFDIIGLQETKIQEKDLEKLKIENLDYYKNWCHAEKPGYSGVATFSKKNPNHIEIGMGMTKYDIEGRVLQTDFDNFSLINVYIPSGTMGDHRHEFKIEFLNDFGKFIDSKLKKNPNLIVMGDYNIVHKELDIHNPDRKDNPSGYRPDERKWLDDWYNNKFIDAFRYVYPDKKHFSWWSYRAGAFKKNLGWRIDYISVSNSLKDKIKDVKFYTEQMFSDHCPVILNIDL